jgi:hypothetical protein
MLVCHNCLIRLLGTSTHLPFWTWMSRMAVNKGQSKHRHYHCNAVQASGEPPGGYLLSAIDAVTVRRKDSACRIGCDCGPYGAIFSPPSSPSSSSSTCPPPSYPLPPHPPSVCRGFLLMLLRRSPSAHKPGNAQRNCHQPFPKRIQYKLVAGFMCG